MLRSLTPILILVFLTGCSESARIKEENSLLEAKIAAVDTYQNDLYDIVLEALQFTVDYCITKMAQYASEHEYDTTGFVCEDEKGRDYEDYINEAIRKMDALDVPEDLELAHDLYRMSMENTKALMRMFYDTLGNQNDEFSNVFRTMDESSTDMRERADKQIQNLKRTLQNQIVSTE